MSNNDNDNDLKPLPGSGIITGPMDLEPIKRLTRDLAKASITLSRNEARYLVDSYYSLQKYRIATAGQVRALDQSAEPHDVIGWLLGQCETLEKQIARALDQWSAGQPLCQWARSIVGIGPVIASGLAAHIDIHKAPTVGHIWRFGGLDPTLKWEKGKKRPWNAGLKTLLWKVGESFVKVSSNPNDVYGRVYQERKEDEARRNLNKAFSQQAADKLAQFNIGKDTDAYKAYSIGMLPPAHIHARAKRYAVKLFLAHYHHVAWELEFKTAPPKPYIIEHGGHVHFIAPPNWPMETGAGKGAGKRAKR